MTNKSFHDNLEETRNKILKMGNLVDDAIGSAITALKSRNKDVAEKIIMDDEKIDKLELEIEQNCLSLIALQQPMARDLRFIGTAIKINTDLERMGDYAANISKIVLSIGDEPFIKPLIDLPRMAELSQEMVRKNMTAYINRDREMAIKAAALDHEIDHLYNQIFRDLLVFMTKDSRNIRQSTYLLMAARHFERIGDHATNVSEWIIYMATGERVELND
ncbi:MAG: phosphate signaling complex protein PhoU [Clostridiales bacterium]|nr:phosphate signaling complex protein PhoU [Clostridiales bacterium]MCF8021862.1 phosphate signaling complex protein PhoU [Clostridiales bacterium]